MHRIITFSILILLTQACFTNLEKDIVPENVIDLKNGFWHQVSPNLDPSNTNWRIHEFRTLIHTEYVLDDFGTGEDCWVSAYNLNYRVDGDTLYHYDTSPKFIFKIEGDSLFTFNKLLDGSFSRQPIKYLRKSSLGYTNCG